MSKWKRRHSDKQAFQVKDSVVSTKGSSYDIVPPPTKLHTIQSFPKADQIVFYHVTDASNLEYISKHGLKPTLDKRHGVEGLKDPVVVNLALNEGSIDEIIHVFTFRAQSDYFPVILRVKCDNAHIVNSGRFTWAMSPDTIRPSNIEVYDVPWDKQKSYLGEIREEFEIDRITTGGLRT